MNHLLGMLLSQDTLPRTRVVVAALLSGLSGVLVLGIVNEAAAEIAGTGLAQVDWALAAAFAAGIALYAGVEVFAVSRLCAALENAIHQVRTGLLDRLVRADYEQVERVGHTVFYESITQATREISQNSQFIALALRSAVLVVVILAYIAFVSLTAFALVGLTIGLGGLLYYRAGRRRDDGFARMMDEERRLFESLDDLLGGFKEVRISSARSRDLAATFARFSLAATDVRVDVQGHVVRQFILGQIAVYLMLAVVVFVIPQYVPGFRDQVVQITAAVLFMSGDLGALIQYLPLLAESEQAAARIARLEATLAAMAEDEGAAPSAAAAAPAPAAFGEIAFCGVTYAYPAPEGEAAFALGPLDLTLRAGEIVFITGGNGAGKSTLIKLLTGLYRPKCGAIRIDGATVGPRLRHALRDRIATVFSSYHLFPRLYGAAPFTPAEAETMLSWLEMERVAALTGDRFSRIDLSAGQRKRLALMAALLERRPLLVLDEWAADQDPAFRRKFYREILPTLKAEGKTIVAVTHDDSYFDVADRRFHLEEGRLVERGRDAGEEP
jgi:putative ATP-binding cassette transporter